MTIRARNIFVLIFVFFSLAVSVFFALWTLLSFLTGTLQTAPSVVESSESTLAVALAAMPVLPHFLSALFSYNFFAVLFSVFALSFTMPVTMVLMYIHFEKTQSQECVYFSAFLLACLAETARLVIPIASLWDSNTILLFVCAKIIFFGRILALLSFIFFVLSTAIGQTSESGSHFFVILLLSLVFALIIPVNTLRVLPACTVEFGFSRIFDVVKIVFFILTAFAFFLNAREKSASSRDAYFVAAGYVMLFPGYSILLFSDNFALALLGIILLGAGTILHLTKIHKIYRWE